MQSGSRYVIILKIFGEPKMKLPLYNFLKDNKKNLVSTFFRKGESNEGNPSYLINFRHSTVIRRVKKQSACIEVVLKVYPVENQLKVYVTPFYSYKLNEVVQRDLVKMMYKDTINALEQSGFDNVILEKIKDRINEEDYHYSETIMFATKLTGDYHKEFILYENKNKEQSESVMYSVINDENFLKMFVEDQKRAEIFLKNISKNNERELKEQLELLYTV